MGRGNSREGGGGNTHLAVGRREEVRPRAQRLSHAHESRVDLPPLLSSQDLRPDLSARRGGAARALGRSGCTQGRTFVAPEGRPFVALGD
jgi:hypothetical protein